MNVMDDFNKFKGSKIIKENSLTLIDQLSEWMNKYNKWGEYILINILNIW